MMKKILLTLLAFSLYAIPNAAKAQSDDEITIVAVGDVMLGSILPNRSYLPPEGEEKKLFDDVKQHLQGDVVFCNVEGTFADQKIGAKQCNNPSQCYTFGMPTSYAKVYRDAGFNLVSVANNHSGDFSEYGKGNARRLFDSLGVNWAGFVDKPTAEFTINGVKYGFCAFAPNNGTVSIHDLDGAKALVRKLSETCDIVIVSFHGGAEGRSYQHVPRTMEHCFGENRGNVYQFAHTLIDEGADIVLGHGPHVTRCVEIYKDRFIAYSMGNFATYSNVSITGESGLAPIFRVKMNGKTGNFISAEIVPTYQIKGKGPLVDPQKRVIKVIQNLTKADMKDNLPTISDEGKITK
ncbi:MAG: CapA family protein [Bacteroidales bacterium]|nr:CapA family protein [Bacteroidales bacterium]